LSASPLQGRFAATDRQLEDTMRVLESFSAWYEPASPQMVRVARDDPKTALKMFLTYAFGGRSGAPKEYWVAALHAVDETWTGSAESDVIRIWQRFRQIVDKANDSRNPLNSAIDQKIPAVLGLDFVDVLRRLELGQVREAFIGVRRVRGVGVKIASFFLRDVVHVLGLYDSAWDVGASCYVQPVDLWVRETALALGLQRPVPDAVMNRDLGVDAPYIWGLCWMCKQYGINPLRFNEGAWIYGSQVASTVKYLRRLLKEGPQSMVTAALRVQPWVPDFEVAKLQAALREAGLDYILRR